MRDGGAGRIGAKPVVIAEQDRLQHLAHCNSKIIQSLQCALAVDHIEHGDLPAGGLRLQPLRGTDGGLDRLAAEELRHRRCATSIRSPSIRRRQWAGSVLGHGRPCENFERSVIRQRTAGLNRIWAEIAPQPLRHLQGTASNANESHRETRHVQLVGLETLLMFALPRHRHVPASVLSTGEDIDAIVTVQLQAGVSAFGRAPEK